MVIGHISWELCIGYEPNVAESQVFGLTWWRKDSILVI